MNILKERKILFIIDIFIFLAVLFLFQFAFIRCDFTESKMYTVSDKTKKIIENLPDTVYIDYYRSNNMGQFASVERYIMDFLNEMKYQVRNVKIRYRYAEGPAINVLGLNALPTQGTSSSGLTYFSQIYSGISIEYAGDREVIPLIIYDKQMSDLEYSIVKAIDGLTGKKINVGLYVSDQYVNQNHFSVLDQYIQREYEYTRMGFYSIPDQTKMDVLIWAGNGTVVDPSVLFYLDQYMMRGGKVIFFSSGNSIDMRRETIYPTKESPFLDMIKFYGLEVNQNLMIDVDRARRIVLNREGQRVVEPYPAWIRLDRSNINQEIDFMDAFSSGFFIWGSSLSLVHKDADKFTPILRSSSSSFSVENLSSLMPNVLNRQNQRDKSRSHDLAYLVSGSQKSYYSDTNNTKPEKVSDTDFDNRILESDVRYIFVADTFYAMNTPNNSIYNDLNLIDLSVLWLSGRSDLLSIRNKTFQTKTLSKLETESDFVQAYLKLVIVNVGVIPLLIIIYALVRWILYYVHLKKYRRNLS